MLAFAKPRGESLGAFLLIFSSFPGHAQVEERAEPATEGAVRLLLMDVWKAPAERVKRLGSGVVARASRQKGDMAQIQYAFALVLIQHELWDAAEPTLKRLVEKSPGFAMGWLALAEAQVRANKIDAALSSLKKAGEADPTSVAVAEAAGRLLPFFKARPPERVKRGAVEETENAIFAALGDAQANYRAAATKTTEYLAAAGERKKESRQKVKDLRELETKRQSELAARDADRAKEEAKMAELQMKLNVIVASVGINAAALGGKSLTLYESRILASQFALPYQDVKAAIDKTSAELASIDKERGKLKSSIKLLRGQAKEEETKFEEREKRPPEFFSPTKERDRLLAQLSPAEEAPKKSRFDKKESKESKVRPSQKATPEEERKAQTLLNLADALRDSGKTEQALRYYRRVVELYPHSAAARPASKSIEKFDSSRPSK